MKPKTLRKFTALLIVTLALALGVARAQDDDSGDNGNNNDSGLRTVYGEVTDKADKPLHDARVYLENTRTLTVRTYISSPSGEYRFAGLDPNADYEIHAEFGDLTSSKRTVSSFDSRKEIHAVLKVNKEKKKDQ